MLRGPQLSPRSRFVVHLLIFGACFALAAESAAAPLKVACIGEHTTHSHAFPADNREAQPPGMQEYPAQLQTLLGPGYEVRNFGDCCATVLQGYTPQPGETHPYVNGTNPNDGVGYKESIAFLPDVVIIGSWGRHDWGLAKATTDQVFTLQGFQDGYDDLVKRYQALASHPKIFVSLPIPILNGQGDVPDQGVKTSDVLPSVNAVATKYELPVIDLYGPFLNHQELFKQPPDPNAEGEGEHITAAGVTVLANAVFAAMQKDLQASAGSGGASGAAGTAGGGGVTAGGESGAAAAGLAGAATSMGGTNDGAAGTAGSAGSSGGSPGAAGQVSAVGQAGTGATLPAAGSNGVTAPPSPGSDAGCGCRVVAAKSRAAEGLALWLALGAALLARKRRG